MARGPATRLPLLYLVLATALITCSPLAQAGLNSTGKWTSKYGAGATWNHIPVHLVLTRGYHGYHSEILWYNSHPEGDALADTLLGGVWGWSPIDSFITADCDSYPVHAFTALSHGRPTHNVFCSGLANLADGRVLIPGGSEIGETGVTRSVFFDPDSRDFASTGDMFERRWYPTATSLPNGDVAVTLNRAGFFGDSVT
jgi:hypothetical protein